MAAPQLDGLDFLQNAYYGPSYFTRRSADLWISIALIAATFVALAYIGVQNKLAQLRAQWSEIRCTPSILPIAGMINHAPGQSSTEATGENFTYCLQSLFKEITYTATASQRYLSAFGIELSEAAEDAFELAREVYNRVRELLESMIQIVMDKLIGLTLPVFSAALQGRDALQGVLAVIIVAFNGVLSGGSAAVSVVGIVFCFVAVVVLGIAFGALLLLFNIISGLEITETVVITTKDVTTGICTGLSGTGLSFLAVVCWIGQKLQQLWSVIGAGVTWVSMALLIAAIAIAIALFYLIVHFNSAFFEPIGVGQPCLANIAGIYAGAGAGSAVAKVAIQRARQKYATYMAKKEARKALQAAIAEGQTIAAAH